MRTFQSIESLPFVCILFFKNFVSALYRKLTVRFTDFSGDFAGTVKLAFAIIEGLTLGGLALKSFAFAIRGLTLTGLAFRI